MNITKITYAQTVAQTATSNQYAQILKAVGSIDSLNELVDVHSDDLQSIKGIGPKLVEVLSEASVSYYELLSHYPTALLEELGEIGKLELQVALDSLTKALRSTADPEVRTAEVKEKLPVVTKQVLIQVATSDRVVRADVDQWWAGSKWTMDGKTALPLPTLADSKRIMRVIAETYKAALDKASPGVKPITHPVVKLYVVTCHDGVPVSRKSKPFLVWDAVQMKTLHVVKQLPVLG